MVADDDLRSYALSEQEKDRIRAEELYRNQVKAECEPPRTWLKQAWGFLNSAFFLTAVIAILGTLLGWMYQEYGSWQARRDQTQQRRDNIALEISVRCAQAESQFTNSKLDDKQQISQARKMLDGEIGASVHEELDNRKLVSLLYEEASLVGLEQQASIEDLAEKALSLPILDKTQLSRYVTTLKKSMQPHLR